MGTLTNDELIDLTGYHSGKYQAQWLRDRGWRFELNRLKRPKVDREYYRRRMGVEAAEPAVTGPNWAAR